MSLFSWPLALVFVLTGLPVLGAGVEPPLAVLPPLLVVGLAPLVFVVTGLSACGATGAGRATAGLRPAVGVAAVLRLVCVLTGFAAGAAGLPTGTVAAGAGAVGAAPVVPAVRARLAAVRGAAGSAVAAEAVATEGETIVVRPAVVPGRGGAAAAGVRERLGVVGFSCLTIQMVRRTTCVRTSTGTAAGPAFGPGRSANVVIAPSATSVTAPATVVAGVFRIAYSS